MAVLRYAHCTEAMTVLRIRLSRVAATYFFTTQDGYPSIFRAWLYPMTGGTRTAALLHVPYYYPLTGGTRSAALQSYA